MCQRCGGFSFYMSCTFSSTKMYMEYIRWNMHKKQGEQLLVVNNAVSVRKPAVLKKVLEKKKTEVAIINLEKTLSQHDNKVEQKQASRKKKSASLEQKKVLDTPGVLVPSIPDIETGLKLAAAGSVKDSAVGEERIAQYTLALLNCRGTPLCWSHLKSKEKLQNGPGIKCEYRIEDLLPKREKTVDDSYVRYILDVMMEVQQALYACYSSFDGNLEAEEDMETLIEQHFEALQKALRIPHTASEGRKMTAKRFLTLLRMGKLGRFILDDVPDIL